MTEVERLRAELAEVREENQRAYALVAARDATAEKLGQAAGRLADESKQLRAELAEARHEVARLADELNVTLERAKANGERLLASVSTETLTKWRDRCAELAADGEAPRNHPR